MRRTTVQTVALVFGVVFILIGLLGFLTDGGMEMGVEDPGLVLGLFPVNLLHNLVHLAFGAWGIAASRTHPAAVQYCRIAGIIYLVLVVLAFVDPTTFGLVPIGGNDIWLHAILAVALAGVGFTARAVPDRNS